MEVDRDDLWITATLGIQKEIIMAEKNCKLLVGSQQIMTYLQVSKTTFYKFVKMGMPAVIIDNRWYAYSENLDDYMKALTRRQTKEIPDDVD
jgi:hypothetical protein